MIQNEVCKKLDGTTRAKCGLELAYWLRVSDCQCQCSNNLEFDTSILRYSGIWRAAAETVLIRNLTIFLHTNKIKITTFSFYLYFHLSCSALSLTPAVDIYGTGTVTYLSRERYRTYAERYGTYLWEKDRIWRSWRLEPAAAAHAR